MHAYANFVNINRCEPWQYVSARKDLSKTNDTTNTNAALIFIVYLGPHSYPDFDTDYLLSPIVAPSSLLSQFPKIYMMCGEKDPFVDDTVIFAGRIRKAKREMNRKSHHHEDDSESVTVRIMEGMSHAFLQMIPFLPDGDRATKAIGRWAQQILSSDDTKAIMTKSKSLSNVAAIVTNEKDMIYRRRKGLVDGLYTGINEDSS
jgi:acetyl esterase/lipase